MKNDKLIMLYDFDGTLTKSPVCAYSFIDRFGYKNGMQNDKFIGEVRDLQKQNGKEFVEVCLEHVFEICEKNGLKPTLKNLCEGQDKLDWNPGVDTFFDKVEAMAKRKGVTIENYLITGGFAEYLENLPLAKHFKGIYGSRLEIDKQQNILGIKSIMTNQLKVDNVKKIAPDDCKNVIYVGDGLTDIPPMEYVCANGGKALFVSQEKVPEKMLESVTHVCRADFREDKGVFAIISRAVDELGVERCKD